jgi:hypothetical protein
MTTLPPPVNPEVTTPIITNPDLTGQPGLLPETTPPAVITNPDLTQPPINSDQTSSPPTNQETTPPPAILPEGQQTTQAPATEPPQSATTIVPNLPADFPTPSTLSQAIAETGFPMPPLNVDSNNDGPQTGKEKSAQFTKILLFNVLKFRDFSV